MSALEKIRTKRFITALLLMNLFILGSSVLANDFKSVFNPTLVINKAMGTIKIDGKLNDSGWDFEKNCVNHFHERFPGDNTKPEVDTRGCVTYDDDYLYIAFICHDDPNEIRATMCQRDQFHGDDAIGFMVDTYGDASWAYEFFVNPYGIQKDMLWTNIIGEDQGYDLIWKSAAQVTDSGYQVEIAVPFSGIRFPNKDIQTWKIDFWRVRPRESYFQYSWAANDRNEQCFPCKWGSVEGISAVHPGKGIEVIPAFISNQSSALANFFDSDSPFENGDINGEPSLTGKYSVSSDVTMEAAVNPDFSQIEGDAAQIDVNTTVALFFPERRPYFQEGRDIFRTLFNSFYTRTINVPQISAKLTGRTDKYRFGFLSAVDENTPYLIPFYESSSPVYDIGKSYVNVLRGIRTIGHSSQIGFIINDRRFESGGHNSIAALDGDIRLSRNYNITGQYVFSSTKEPDAIGLTSRYINSRFGGDNDTLYNYALDGESYTGFAFITQFRRNARNWNFNFNFDQTSKTYQTQTGYDPWNNYRNFSFFTNYHFYFEKGLFERVTPRFNSYTRWTMDNDRKWTHYSFGLNNQLRFAQTSFMIGYDFGDEMWYGGWFKNLWNLSLNLNSRLSDKIGYFASFNKGVGVSHGTAEKGNETSYSLSLNLKPFDRLVVEPSYNYYASERLESGGKLSENYIGRMRIRFQFTKALSLRLVVQHVFSEWLEPVYVEQLDEFGDPEYVLVDEQYSNWKKWDIDPLLTFRLSSFSVFYIGTTHDYDDFLLQSPLMDYDDTRRDMSLSNRQYFMKLQYLFQM